MANLGKFQTQDFDFWTGITTDNHLKAAFHEQPQRLGEFIQTLQAYRYGPTLINYLSRFKKIEFERDDEYTWDIATSSRRNIMLVEARCLDGTVVDDTMQVGVGGEPFYLVFGEHWFNDGDVIVGNYNEAYPIRILGHPRMEGTHAVHRCELMGGVTGGIPGERLLYGERFSKEYAPVEKELSRGVSDIHFMSSAAMRNEFSRIRIRTKVPGDKFGRKIAVGVPMLDKNTGKMTTQNYWMHYVDMQLEDEFSDDKNHLVMYGRSNRSTTGEYQNIGKSGKVLTMGAGIREQMEQANFEYYNKFSLKLLNDSIFNLIDHLPKSAMPNTITLRTGRRGAMLFSEAVANQVSGWERWELDAASLGMVRKTTSELHPNALAAGAMFTEWHGPMNVNIKVIVDPMFDDPVRNKLMHHLGGVAESYRMEFDLLGTAENSNVNLVGVKGEGEIRGYKVGLRNPFDGNKQVDFMATDEDSTEIHKMWTGGALVKDPTAHFTLVPSEYAA